MQVDADSLHRFSKIFQNFYFFAKSFGRTRHAGSAVMMKPTKDTPTTVMTMSIQFTTTG